GSFSRPPHGREVRAFGRGHAPVPGCGPSDDRGARRRSFDRGLPARARDRGAAGRVPGHGIHPLILGLGLGGRRSGRSQGGGMMSAGPEATPRPFSWGNIGNHAYYAVWEGELRGVLYWDPAGVGELDGPGGEPVVTEPGWFLVP